MTVSRPGSLTLNVQSLIEQASAKLLILIIVLIASTLLSQFLLFGSSIEDVSGATSQSPKISDLTFSFEGEGQSRSNRPLKSRKSKVLAALPIGNSDDDIKRVSKAVQTWSKFIDVDWVLFHYQPKDKLEKQNWYNKSVIFSVEEKGFLYGYFYKYLVAEYITNLHTYKWIWLINSDCTYHELDVQTFLKILDTWLPAVAQPAVIGSYWDISAPQWEKIGRVTTFIEIGPFVALSVEAWAKIHNVMNPLFNSGWGLDMLWCSLLKKPAMVEILEQKAFRSGQIVGENMFCPTNIEFVPSCMVVDESPIVHLDRREGSQMGVYSDAIGLREKHWYRQRYSNYWDETHRSLCSIF